MLLINKKTTKTKQNLKKYNNTNFNFNNFLQEYYIDENGNAYIYAKVNSIFDIISKYSTKGHEWINQEFIEYIENVAYYIPVEEAITIEISGCNFKDEEQLLIAKVIKQYFGLKLGDSVIDIKIMKKKSRFLLGFGFISTLLFMLLSLINVLPTIAEIIAIGLWFFLWEFLDLVLLDGSKLAVKKLEAAQLANIKIKFK